MEVISGKVVNNTGRFKHIFKRNMSPGMFIKLEDVYEVYKDKYGGPFDLKFLEWLQANKIQEGFNIVVDSIDATVSVEDKKEVVEQDDEPAFEVGKSSISKITARQIAGLKTKDNPKSIISQVLSVHKLRRALTMTKDRAGKETLTRYIRDRINELHSSGIHD
jgi:hypothetical protein